MTDRCANGCSVTTTSRKMIVSPTSRMLSAISLGVFWRRAPSTRAIMRSRKRLAGVGGDPHDDPVGEHLRAAGDGAAVAAALADDRRRLAGDGRLVDRGDALDHVAVAGDDLAGRRRRRCRRGAAAPAGTCSIALVRHQVGHRLASSCGAARRPAPCRGPRPSRFGEVGEEHGEPEPAGDRADEGRVRAAGRQRRGRSSRS